MTRPSALRRFRRDLGRAVSWHRRKLAVLAAVGAVLTGIAAAAPEGPPTVAVVQATRQLAGGSVVAAADVEVARVPQAAVPDEALRDPGAVIGKTLLGPVPEGSVLTPYAVVSETATRAGFVTAPLRLADAEVAALVRPGDRVDVLAAEPEAAAAAVVARRVRVLTVPAPAEDSGLGSTAGGEGALLLVEVPADVAARLAQAAVSASISIVLR